MRIVFISYGHSPGFTDPAAWLERIKGHTIVLETLASSHEIHSIEQIDYEGVYEKERVRYHFQKSQSLIPVALHRYIRNLQPDLVVIHGFNSPVQLVHLRWVLPRRVKFIVQNHAEKPGLGKRGFLQRSADRFVDAYLISSMDMARDWVEAGIVPSIKKFTEVMEASSPFHPMQKTGALQRTGATGKPIFLWVGRLDANKDPLTVMHAFTSYARQNDAARLYMIYHTEDLLPEVQTMVNDSSGRIVLVGKVDHNHLQDWYNCANYIVAGSHYEGSGVAVCEAMSCGVIPILTDIPSFRFITGYGACGRLYTPGDKDSLLQTILSVESAAVEEERAKVLKQFEEKLSVRAIASAMDAVFQNQRP